MEKDRLDYFIKKCNDLLDLSNNLNNSILSLYSELNFLKTKSLLSKFEDLEINDLD